MEGNGIIYVVRRGNSNNDEQYLSERRDGVVGQRLRWGGMLYTSIFDKAIYIHIMELNWR